MKTKQKLILPTETYEKPSVEIIEMEIEGSILNSSPEQQLSGYGGDESAW